MAVQDSLHSLSASKDSGVERIVLNIQEGSSGDAKKPPLKASKRRAAGGGKGLSVKAAVGNRPQSEYAAESARFVPKLPPKKKVTRPFPSTYEIVHGCSTSHF